MNENLNEDFFSRLESKPQPAKSNNLLQLPQNLIELNLKNVLTSNLEENEVLEQNVINNFIQHMIIPNPDLKPNVPPEMKAKPFIPITFDNSPTFVISRKTNSNDNRVQAEDIPETSTKKTKKIKSTRKTAEYIPSEININNDFIQQIKNIYYRSPKSDEVYQLPINPKYMYNKGLFKDNIMQILDQYKLNALNTSQESCETREDVNDNIFTPLTHQSLVKDYLNITTPYRGLLLFHGLGSGKTCSSIGIIEGLKYDKKILILTPASLMKNYKVQLQKCGDQIFKSNNFWYFKELNPRSDLQLITEIHKLTAVPLSFIKRNRGVWLIDPSRKPNFNDLSEDEKSQLQEQIMKSIENKYQFIKYNGQLKLTNFFNKFTKNETINPFDHSVVVIDEVHNFISGIVNKFNKPNSISMKLYHLLMDAEDCRIILLSGTPIINYPNEIAVMMNILRGYIKTLEIKLNILTNDKITKDFFKKYFNKLGFIDYFEYNPNNTTLTVTKNPYGFIHQYDDKGLSDGIYLNEQGNIEFKDFERTIVNLIGSIKSKIDKKRADGEGKKREKIFKVVSVNYKLHKNLPDTLDEFSKNFINDNKQIINKQKLQRRIVGLISYLGDKDKLMPEIIHQNIVDVEMSDYQLPIYADARSKEILLESKNKQKRIKSKLMGEIYNETTSTYRIFSRAFCNFVFPPDIGGRPMPNKAGAKELVDESYVDIVTDDTKEANIEGKYDDGDNSDSLGHAETSSYNDKIITALKLLDKDKETYFSPDELIKYSPKFLACLQRLQNEQDYKGNHLIYSQFRTLEGIGILKLVLEANGFVELSLKKKNVLVNNNQKTEMRYTLNIPEDKIGLPKFALYTGTESEEEKEIIRNIFNTDWDNLPEPLLSQVRSLGMNNFMGDVCKILMITSSGAEGINLKNVRYVHIMEPYWHPVRIEQVIGRARRICSHQDLEEQYRNIETFLYITRLSPEQIKSKEHKELYAKDHNLTSDEQLFKILNDKKSINQSIINVLKETSIDCTIHHTGKNQSCFRLPVSDKTTFITKPDFKVASGETKEETVKKVLTVITYKGKKYLYDKQTNDIFDFDDHSLIVGKIIIKNEKKQVKLFKK